MSDYLFQAVPFVPQISSGNNEAQQAATQLNTMIEKWKSDGWEFSHLEDITTIRKNGCIASIFGNPRSLLTVQVAIFKRLG